MPEEYLILTPIGILFLIFIREFFSYLKTKKNSNGTHPTIIDCELRHGFLGQNIVDIKKSIEEINTNHLSHIEPDIVKIKIDIAGIPHISEDIKEIKEDIKKMTEAIWWKQINK